MLRTGLCTAFNQSARVAVAAPSSNVEVLRLQQSGGREGNCGGSTVAVLDRGRCARAASWTSFLEPLSDSPSAEVTRQYWRLLNEFHIIFYAKWTRMQLLHMVLACPSWCDDGVARRFGVVDVSSRSSYLEIWYIFVYDLVFGVMCSVFGWEMTWSLVAMLSSTVDTYSALYWAGSWKNFMIFYVIG